MSEFAKTSGLNAARRWAPIVVPALQQEIVARLKQMIDEGVLMPGSRIPERQLCAQLGVSRTPLREAFHVLATQGLLDVQPRRGARVKKLDPKDVDHMFQVLEALEGLAGELACDRISDERLFAIEQLHKKMMTAYKRKNRRTFFDVNRRIHEEIVAAAGNPILTQVYEGLHGQVLRLRYLAKVTDEQWIIAARDHELIMKALQSRDKKKLRTVLQAHLKNKQERVKSLLAD